MNKKYKIILVALVIVLLIIGILIGGKISLKNKNNKDYGYWTLDNDFLYDIAIDYLKNEKNGMNNNNEKKDYQTFYNYHGFGIKEREGKKYAYMYVVKESYYVKHNKLRSDNKSSMLYKFIFDNNQVVNYEVPKDGDEYAKSVKEIFPDDIEKEALDFSEEKMQYKDEKDKHYSYLNSTVVWDKDYEENALVIIGKYINDKNNKTKETLGKYIDGYGDVFKYRIPYGEKEIDNTVIEKYKEEKITTITKEDLEILKSNLNNMEYSTKKETENGKKIGFVKVAYRDKNKDDNTMIIDYRDSDFIDIIKEEASYTMKNTSKSAENIMNILLKYDLFI